MQTADPGAAPRPLVIANPSAGRGRTGRDLRHLLSALRDALGELDDPRWGELLAGDDTE